MANLPLKLAETISGLVPRTMPVIGQTHELRVVRASKHTYPIARTKVTATITPTIMTTFPMARLDLRLASDVTAPNSRTSALVIGRVTFRPIDEPIAIITLDIHHRGPATVETGIALMIDTTGMTQLPIVGPNHGRDHVLHEQQHIDLCQGLEVTGDHVPGRARPARVWSATR